MRPTSAAAAALDAIGRAGTLRQLRHARVGLRSGATGRSAEARPRGSPARGRAMSNRRRRCRGAQPAVPFHGYQRSRNARAAGTASPLAWHAPPWPQPGMRRRRPLGMIEAICAASSSSSSRSPAMSSTGTGKRSRSVIPSFASFRACSQRRAVRCVERPPALVGPGPRIPGTARDDRRDAIGDGGSRHPRDPPSVRLAPDREALEALGIGNGEHIGSEGAPEIRLAIVRLVARAVPAEVDVDQEVIATELGDVAGLGPPRPVA